jgi:hypothetical protein
LSSESAAYEVFWQRSNGSEHSLQKVDCDSREKAGKNSGNISRGEEWLDPGSRRYRLLLLDAKCAKWRKGRKEQEVVM